MPLKILSKFVTNAAEFSNPDGIVFKDVALKAPLNDVTELKKILLLIAEIVSSPLVLVVKVVQPILPHCVISVSDVCPIKFTEGQVPVIAIV